MTMRAHIARFSTRPDRDEAFGERLRAIAVDTRREAGCRAYELFRDGDGRWTVIEVWADAAAVDLHMQQPYVAALLADLDSYIVEPPHVETLHAGE